MRYRKNITFIIALLIAMMFITSVTSFSSVGKIVRVGYVDCEGFISNDSNGFMTGYAVDYLEEIAEYTGWKYIYKIGTWEECLERLKAGEIDLVCDARYTQERDSFFEYSGRSIGKETSIIYTDKENNEVCYNDFEAMNGKTFGVLKGTTEAEQFEKYSQKNNISYNLAFYDDEKVMEKDVENKKIDFMITKSLAIHKGLKIVGKYGSNPFFFITQEGNTEFMDQINEAVYSISAEDPYFETALHYKYYGKSRVNSEPLFTREELEFIKNSETITVGVLPERSPFSFYDGKEREVAGVTIDILKLIAEKSGLTFEYKVVKKGGCPVASLLEGNVDLAGGVLRTDELLKNKSIVLSSTILESSLVAVGKKGMEFQRDGSYTLVMTGGWKAIAPVFMDNLPNSNIIYKETDKECANAVKNGEADMLIQNVGIINSILQKPAYESLGIIPIYFSNEFDCIVGRSEDNPILMSVINKTIEVIDRAEIDRFLVEYTIANPYQLTVGDFIYKHRVTVCVSMLAMSLIVGLTLWMRKSKKTYSRDMEEKNVQLVVAMQNLEELTELENEKLKIFESPFDLEGLVGYISSSCYYKCKENNLKFKVILKGIKSESIIADQMRIVQIVFNLVSNAVKVTPPGREVKLQIAQRNLGGNDKLLIFEIQDISVAMATEKITSLLVELINGKIIVDKKSDKVISVKIEIPVISSTDKKRMKLRDLQECGILEVETEKAMQVMRRQKQRVAIEIKNNQDYNYDPTNILEDDEGYDLRGCNVLLIEDSDFCRDVTIELLEMIGSYCAYAVNGEEGVEMFKDSEVGFYDIILMDLNMPNINGYEATEIIRRLDRADAKEISILIMTSDASFEEDTNKYKLAGMDDYISKPIDARTLYETLNKYYKG